MKKRAVHRFLLSSIAIILMLLPWEQDAQAHSHYVHPNLTELACELSGVEFPSAQWSVDNFTISDSPSFMMDVAFIVQGSIDEDMKGFFRYRDHMYNPHTLESGKIKPSVTALVAAGRRWEMMEESFEDDSTRFLADGRFEVIKTNGSLHALGRTLHLLQDMAAPPHVHPPHAHGWSYQSGPGTLVPFYSDFEEKWNTHSKMYDGWLIPEIPEGPMTPKDTLTELFPHSHLDARSLSELRSKLQGIPSAEWNTVNGYMKSLAWITYYHSSFYGQINRDVDNPAPAQAAGNENILALMYPDRISYVPASIAHPFSKWWEIEGVGFYESRYRLYVPDDWWPCPGDYPEGSKKVGDNYRGRFYLYHNYYAYYLFYDFAYMGQPWASPPNFFPDATPNTGHTSLAQYYGNVFLPLAVRFSAGLILEVFPGPSSLTLPETSQSGQYTISWEPVPPTPAGSPSYYLLERLSGSSGSAWETLYKGIGLSYDEQVGSGEHRYRIRAYWFETLPIGSNAIEGTCTVVHPTLTILSTEDHSTGGVGISSDTGHGGTTRYTLSIPYGTQVHLAASPYSSIDLRKSFDRWSGSVNSTDMPITLVMDEDKTVMAHYTIPSEHGITLSSTMTVNASVEGVMISSSTGHGGTAGYFLRIPIGTEVHLEVPSYSGSGATRMRFSGWSGSFTSRGTSLRFDILGNVTLTANYVADPEPILHTLSVGSHGADSLVVASGTGHGGITGYQYIDIPPGTQVHLEAPLYFGSGDNRKRFAEWTGALNTKDRSVTFPVTADASVIARYVDDPEIAVFNLNVSSGGAKTVPIASSTGHGGDTHYTVTGIASGTQVHLEAPLYSGSGSERMRFSHWEGPMESTQRSISFALTAQTMATAHYIMDPESSVSYNLTVASSGAKTVSVYSSTGHGGNTHYTIAEISTGTQIHLEVPPYIGSGSERMRFSHWEGAVVGTDQSVMFNLTGHAMVTVYYVEDPEEILHTLTVNSSEKTNIPIASSTGHGGTIIYSVAGIPTGTQVNLEAPQYIGSGADRKRFNNWTGYVNDKTLSINFTMTADATVSANYIDDPVHPGYTLNVQSQNSSNVVITSTHGYGGTTNYSVSGIPPGSTIQLEAPLYVGIGTLRMRFEEWVSKDFTYSTTAITFSMSKDITVTARYVSDPQPIIVFSSGEIPPYRMA